MPGQRRFSLPWVGDGFVRMTAGAYEIDRRGSGWELRYGGTVIHTAASVVECQIEADRHRGVGDPEGMSLRMGRQDG